ncbi:MAG: hypothetical protein R6V39_08555 [Desulfovibrionales bacterium]
MSTDSLSVQNTNTIGTSARPQIQMDNADPARQSQQAASDMDIAQESNPDVREAFQVQISLPAQSRLAADADDSTQDTKTLNAEPSEAQSVPGTGQGQGRGGIIDIMT